MYIIFAIISVFALFKDNKLIPAEGEYILRQDNLLLPLDYKITKDSPKQLDIRLTNDQLFQMPNTAPFNEVYNEHIETVQYPTYEYTIETVDDPFTVNIIRTDTKEKVISLQGIKVSKLYGEFNITIPTKHFFGLGERNQKGFRFREGIYTLYAKDVPQLMEDGKSPGKNVYGSHPVYLMREKSGKYHVLFFKNSSPIDVIYSENQLQFKFVGGVIHLKIFFGGYSAESAIELYHTYLGGWALHPFWAMGYHHSRWPIKTSAELIKKVELHRQNNIPIDTIWSDIDYMMDRQIFSVDEFRFFQQDFSKIQNELHTHYIPIIDVGVGVKYGKQDKGFREGINLDIFLRSPTSGQRLKGKVWPGASYYPDFFHPNTSAYWITMTTHLFQQTNFSGLWIDMNEPTNFCDGECGSDWNRTLDYPDVNMSYRHDPLHLPYIPGLSPLEKMTLPPHLVHYGGYLHKDVHNLYGFQESHVTYQAMKQVGKTLPFIISRSTFAGSGKFTQHWLGDNAATWDFLYLSIGQIFQFGIFGIPMVGADICGFLEDTTVNLCCRWAQLGALYPFMRNHNNDRAKDQEFYALGDRVLLAAQKNVKLRYSILRWYYTLFVQRNHLGTVFKPLFFEFLADERLHDDDVLDTQILLGDALMATPILTEGAIMRKAYFPKASWYNFMNGMRIQKDIESGSDHIIYCNYDDFVPLFIRGGSIILKQNISKVNNTLDLDSHYQATIAMEDSTASGSFMDVPDFSEKSTELYCMQSNCILDISFRVTEDNMILALRRSGDQQPAQNALFIDYIKVYGLEYKEVKCQSNLPITCEMRKTKYPYNQIIVFNDGVGIEFGKNGVSEITLSYA